MGRYKHRAYCYLLVDPNKHLTPNAARRLRAIEEFSDLGAGFAIAMRDLEIRGAGNILGTEQSGHIAAVGYELYCQLLENAVRRLQAAAAQDCRSTSMSICRARPICPDDYVPDMRLKIDLYRRLARITERRPTGRLPGRVDTTASARRRRRSRRMLSLEELQDRRGDLANRRDLPQGPVPRVSATPTGGGSSSWPRRSGGKLRVVDEQLCVSRRCPRGYACRTNC